MNPDPQATCMVHNASGSTIAARSRERTPSTSAAPAVEARYIPGKIHAARPAKGNATADPTTPTTRAGGAS
jgi:hypothetical protein